MLFAETNQPTVSKQAPVSEALERSTRGRQNTATVNFGFQLCYEMLQKHVTENLRDGSQPLSRRKSPQADQKRG